MPSSLTRSGRRGLLRRSPTQLIGEARQPIPAAPGRLQRFDYEYRRKRVRRQSSSFVFVDAHALLGAGSRSLIVAPLTTSPFARASSINCRLPRGRAHPRRPRNPSSTHTAAALYAGFPPTEARRVLRRLEFHYTPKHASWLSMVEIEIGVLKGQCLDRRIDEGCDRLVAEIDAWQSQRNQSGAQINWMFSTDKARTKMAACDYPDPSFKSHNLCAGELGALLN